jgi:hypothetical protein
MTLDWIRYTNRYRPSMTSRTPIPASSGPRRGANPLARRRPGRARTSARPACRSRHLRPAARGSRAAEKTTHHRLACLRRPRGRAPVVYRGRRIFWCFLRSNAARSGLSEARQDAPNHLALPRSGSGPNLVEHPVHARRRSVCLQLPRCQLLCEVRPGPVESRKQSLQSFHADGRPCGLQGTEIARTHFALQRRRLLRKAQLFPARAEDLRELATYGQGCSHEGCSRNPLTR